jgi:hypothetical protein
VPVDPLTQPGVKIAFQGATAFVNAAHTPMGVVFQVGFKDERSGMTAHVAMTRLEMAAYLAELTRVRDEALSMRGGDDGEVAGQTG